MNTRESLTGKNAHLCLPSECHSNMTTQKRSIGLSGAVADGFSAPNIYPVHYVCDHFRTPKDQMQETEKGDSKRTFNAIYYTKRGPFR